MPPRKHPWTSGFCGPRMPDESHRRCSGSWRHLRCSCGCHDVVEVEIVDGPILVDVEVGSDEWHVERRKGVTASEIAGLLGIAPDRWSSPFNLFWLKAVGIGEERDSDSMAWGRDLEAAILRRFGREHSDLDVVQGALYRSCARPWQMATPDGLAYSECGLLGDDVPDPTDLLAVVQAKTDGNRDGWGEEGTDEIPPYYVAQVRWEMDVMGVGVAYVPVLFGGHDYREYVVEQNVEDVALMRKEALAFLDRIARADPPPVDWREATTRTLKQLHDTVDDEEVEVPVTWVRQWQLADRLEKAAATRKALAENRIRDRMGRAARAVVDGKKVASRSVYDVKERVQTVRAHTVNKLYVTHKEIL